jgi:hypothetical protein
MAGAPTGREERLRVMERRWSWLRSRVWVCARGGREVVRERKLRAVSAAVGRDKEGGVVE